MNLPPPVRVTLVPSRRAFALIALLACATAAIIVTLPFHAAYRVLAIALVAVWAFERIVVIALRRGPRAVRNIDVRGDLTVVVSRGDGTAFAGKIHRDTYVGARISTLVWQPFGSWWKRSILLLPDMLPADDFRRLRILLRYGRSGVAHGSPASHA